MSDYIAYNSVEKWGDYEPRKKFNFYSGKSKSYLRSSIGCSVWVIVGTRTDKKTKYHLAGRYTPTKILPRPSGGFNVIGSGEPFLPPVELTKLPWFSHLLRMQGNFSHGF